MTHGCIWLVEVPSGNPEPDSYADTVRIVPCGAPIEPGATEPFCPGHLPLIKMDLREFEAWVESKEC